MLVINNSTHLPDFVKIRKKELFSCAFPNQIPVSLRTETVTESVSYSHSPPPFSPMVTLVH